MFTLKKNIVIIEDDTSINHGIELVLGLEEYRFVHCYTLSEAEKLTLDETDLIILDINLPDGNGMDFLKK